MTKYMIKKIYLIYFVIFSLSACEMFEIDNYDGPNATLKGGIKDVVTGDLVETTLQNGSTLKLKELGWAPGGILTRVVMENGEYQDKMMFSGKYSVTFSECNFFPFDVDEIVIDKGENVRDFEVTPYIRVKNVNIRREDDQIVATFNLQAGDPSVRLSKVQLYFSTDKYVGEPYSRLPLNGTGFLQTFSPTIVIDESVEHRLTIDLSNVVNKEYMKYKQNYFFRVGALADVSGVGTIRPNYAPYKVINFSTLQ